MNTKIEVTRVEGLRFAAMIRGHVMMMDQPASNGGTDTAPTPMELLSVALGGCVALYVHQFCAARGIDDDELRVAVVADTAQQPYRVDSFRIILALPEGMPAQYRDAIERVIRSCPVHNTLAHPPRVELALGPSAPAPETRSQLLPYTARAVPERR